MTGRVREAEARVLEEWRGVCKREIGIQDVTSSFVKERQEVC